MSQTYNILCESRVNRERHTGQWHIAPSALTAEVDGKIIRYNGREHILEGISTGLDQSAVVLYFNVRGLQYSLYTDTPADGVDITPEAIREKAKRAMEIGAAA